MLRDDIKKFVADQKPAVLAVPSPELPNWDGQIFVTRVSPLVLEQHRKNVENDEDNERASFVQLVACDAEGSRIFQEEDILWLSTCAALMPLIERLYWAGREVSGLTDENRESWRKNSKSTGENGSPCSCAAPSLPATDSTSSGS
jgi:hypothetical protein